jgi:hypothetical protein
MAAWLERRVADEEFADFPPAVRDPGSAYLIYAAMGGPADSIVRYERQVRATMSTQATSRERRDLQRNFLVRPASILFPNDLIGRVLEEDLEGDYLLEAIQTFRRGDTAGTIARLASIARMRREERIPYAMMDGVLPEARLLVLTGQIGAGAQWLDSAFVALGNAPATAIADAVQMGSLVQAMAYRADLAATLGDRPGARYWAGGVLTLWANADPGFAPVLERMGRIVRQ